jgi:hypothetical protein
VTYIKKHFFILIICLGLCLWAQNILVPTVGDVAASADVEALGIANAGIALSTNEADPTTANGNIPLPTALMLLCVSIVGLIVIGQKKS